MIDDIDEINLAPDRSGSAKKIRSGKKRAAGAFAEARNKPLWKRQLRARKKSKPVPVTLSSTNGNTPHEA